jgi:hypothetical protein
MPKPERATSPMVFPEGRLDPIGARVHVRLTATDVWQALIHLTSKGGTGIITYPVATYRLVLGYYTERPTITDPHGGPMRSAIRHVAAWLVLTYHSPAIGDPGPNRDSTTPHPPSPPCFFLGGMVATDANTGDDLGGGTT